MKSFLNRIHRKKTNTLSNNDFRFILVFLSQYMEPQRKKFYNIRNLVENENITENFSILYGRSAIEIRRNSVKVNDDLERSNCPNNPTAINIYVVRNRDGSIRWAFPEQHNLTGLFKLYSSSPSKRYILQILYYFPPLRQLIFEKIKLYDVEVTGFEGQVCAYSGVKGPYQKFVIYRKNKGMTAEFLKLPIGILARRNCLNEMRCLKYINDQKLHILMNISVPQGRAGTDASSLIINDIGKVCSPNIEFGSQQANFVKEMSKINPKRWIVSELPRIVGNYNELREFQSADYDLALADLLELIKDIYPKILNREISTSFAHGDFTPWNCTTNQNKLGVIDWEMASFDYPILFDFFHFIYSQEILVRQNNAQQIRARLLKLNMLHEFGYSSEDFSQFHFLYLLVQGSVHLEGAIKNSAKAVPQVGQMAEVYKNALLLFSNDGDLVR